MNYKIIQDINQLENFINKVLPNSTVGEGQQFYVSLLGRNKWNPTPEWKGDQAQIKRFTSSKDRLIDKIRALECKQGTYKNGNIEISEKNLGLYIMPNIRSMKKAQLKLAKEIVTNMENGSLTDNPQAMALSAIQKSPYKKTYFDLDVDVEKEELSLKTREQIHNEISSILGIECWSIFTNGGLHTLVDLDRIENSPMKNKWYMEINNFSNKNKGVFKIEMNGDNLLPIPGCIQGNWVPLLFGKNS